MVPAENPLGSRPGGDQEAPRPVVLRFRDFGVLCFGVLGFWGFGVWVWTKFNNLEGLSLWASTLFCSHLAYLDYGGVLFILILSAVPPRRTGSMAAPSPPLRRPKKRTEIAPRKLQRKTSRTRIKEIQMNPDTRSLPVTTPVAPPLRPPPRPSPPPPLRPHLSQFSSTGGAVLPAWVLRKKSRIAGPHLSSASRSPTRPSASPSSPPH